MFAWPIVTFKCLPESSGDTRHESSKPLTLPFGSIDRGLQSHWTNIPRPFIPAPKDLQKPNPTDTGLKVASNKLLMNNRWSSYCRVKWGACRTTESCRISSYQKGRLIRKRSEIRYEVFGYSLAAGHHQRIDGQHTTTITQHWQSIISLVLYHSLSVTLWAYNVGDNT